MFTRILDFNRDFLARLRNKRSHPRYRVGATFPLKAMVNLTGDDTPMREDGAIRKPGCDWGGPVGDIASNGLNIIMPTAATTVRGESSVLRLTLENHELVIPCRVAHFRVYPGYSLCGLRLQFDDFKVQKAYQQLVGAVSMGASFAPAGAGRGQSGFVRRTWRSVNKTLLTDWREADGRALDHFELTLGEHSVQGQNSRSGLEVHPRGDNAKSVPPAVEGEVRQLFRWVVGNLPKNVPADLREFMTRFAGSPLSSAPATWRAPVRASAPTRLAVAQPPSAWQPPKPRIITSA